MEDIKVLIDEEKLKNRVDEIAAQIQKEYKAQFHAAGQR